MSDNKPPMTVWITGRQTPCEAIKKHHPIYAPFGPYVHLDQFMDEAKKRAKKMNRYLPEVMELMREEINDQTISKTKPPEAWQEIYLRH